LNLEDKQKLFLNLQKKITYNDLINLC